jgi:lyso-ornithine lipid O-acyltransferase
VSNTWYSELEPKAVEISVLGWVLVGLRGLILAVLVFGGLAVLLCLRLFERPVHGMHRPWTPYVTQFVCKATFRILGIKILVHGTPLVGNGALVANHSSWLDIFALNACERMYFVSKDEVAGWPAIGWLARATGTLFIRRDAQHAKMQQALFDARLRAGHRLLFFPEGTSTDGLRVLPFKATLFGPFFATHLGGDFKVQPIAVVYTAPPNAEGRFYGWWGGMDFGPHLAKILATLNQGKIEVRFLPALNVANFSDRKALAKVCENAVRSAHTFAQSE